MLLIGLFNHFTSLLHILISILCILNSFFLCGCLIYAKTGEDKDYSTVASVELKKLFPKKKVDQLMFVFFKIGCLFIEAANKIELMLSLLFQINKVTETSLSANQERGEMEKKRLIWKVEGSSEESKVARGGPVDPEKLLVELAPMEIRTFLIDLDYLNMVGS